MISFTNLNVYIPIYSSISPKFLSIEVDTMGSPTQATSPSILPLLVLTAAITWAEVFLGRLGEDSMSIRS